MSCPHELTFGGLCTVCGANVATSVRDDSHSRLGSLHPKIRVRNAQVDGLRTGLLQDMYARRRLLLVLDLDHTLICAERDQFKRPDVDWFLEEASKLFDLALFTLGGDRHAKKSLSILDPHNKLFNGRVISTEALVGDDKRLDLFVQDERVCLILDDSPHVWTSHLSSLIPCVAFWGEESDRYLCHVFVLLRELHTLFYSAYDLHLSEPTEHPFPDVRIFLDKKRREILSGLEIVFSGLWSNQTAPSSQLPWKLAELFGADCSDALSDTTTHLVAGRDGTRKTHRAREEHIHVVSLEWLLLSIKCFKKQPEERFTLPPLSSSLSSSLPSHAASASASPPSASLKPSSSSSSSSLRNEKEKKKEKEKKESKKPKEQKSKDDQTTERGAEQAGETEEEGEQEKRSDKRYDSEAKRVKREQAEREM